MNCRCNGYSNLVGVCPHGHFQVVTTDGEWHQFSKPECCSICVEGISETMKLVPAAERAGGSIFVHPPWPIQGDDFIPPKCPIDGCPNSVAYWIPRGDERPMVSDRCHNHDRMRGRS